MKFTEIPYSRPDVDKLVETCNKLAKDFANAQSAKEQLEIFKQFEKATSDFYTQESLVYIRNSVDMNDEFYKAEKSFFDVSMPKATECSINFTKEMLNSKFQKELREELGDNFFDSIENDQKTFSPEIMDLMAEESDLANQYQALTASAKIEFDGKVLNLSQLGLYKQSPDREVRKAAAEAEGKFFDENREAFDAIYDKLVKNRHQQALKLGFKNFVELSYVRKSRPYTMEDVAKFRKQVLEIMVPKNVEYKKQQAERIHISDFKSYDDPIAYPDGNAMPKYPTEKLVKLAQQMYSEMSPETKEMFDLMVENELFDLDAKPGKRPGGYCATITNYGYPFIFANSNGTQGDIDTLTHEAGHALASVTGSKTIEYPSLRHASAEGAETHSISMEFLTSPWHHLFFEEDTAKYQESHLKNALYFIPYGVIVDYFQELVYLNPDWTPEERNQAWLKLESQFRPYLDYDNLPCYSRGAGWQRQLHIYTIPFYYIEYSLAHVLALQVYSIFLKDSKAAWEKYMKFLRVGGKMNILDTIKYAGMESPFEDGSLLKTCQPIYELIEKLYG